MYFKIDCIVIRYCGEYHEFYLNRWNLCILICLQKISGGLYFQHGFSTVVAAKRIGSCCHINQQVTIGYSGSDAPIIEDNVVVAAGAIIIGKVHVGSDSVVGAGSVVTKDVPEQTVVAGVPARVLRGKVDEENRNTNISLGG